MKEIGGYLELDKYKLPMLYEDAILLNCGRNALGFIIRARKIKKIYLPKFLCGCVEKVCRKENIQVCYYSVGIDFLPCDLKIEEEDWLYLVNYYGQISNEKIEKIAACYKNVIVDNAQAYFQSPVNYIDTIYTCRKFFGVSDGAVLYTTDTLRENLEQDKSYERMDFVLGRFEENASNFYEEASKNNDFFDDEPIKTMSELTKNLLHAVNYDEIKRQREDNFAYLHNEFKSINKLSLTIPQGAFMYPLYIENGDELRGKLQEIKIYVPTLWPDVLELCDENSLEYDMAKNILPLPVDQRYGLNEMKYIAESIKNIKDKTL